MTAQDEFLKLFLAHQQEIRGFISAAVRDPQARDDLFQEVSLTLWRTIDRYDSARPFGTWARGIARNLMLQKRRDSARGPVLLSPEALESLTSAWEETNQDDGSFRDALRECLTKTTEKVRRLLALRYRTSLSLAEIATRLRSNLNAVNQALIRARLALGVCIESRRREELRQGRGAS